MTSATSWRAAVALAVVLLAVGLPAVAQTTAAALEGAVRTEAGRPVPDATVQARSVESGAVRLALSDERGRYRIDSLTPGEWLVVATLGDGRLSDSRTVALGLQQTVRLDFTVSGETTEQVTVRAEAPLVDRRRTAGALRIGGAQADALPIAGRNMTDLALLDSSVRPSGGGSFYGERGSAFVVNGASGRSNSFLVDGVDNNDQISGTTVNAFFSQQVLREFVLLTHQFAPEFGRAAGGVLNIVTKRGTNERTFDGFIQGTSDGWNEVGPFIESLPDRGVRQETPRRLQTGVSFGGPIKRDKLFYFAAYEHQQDDSVYPYSGIDRDGVAGGRFVAPSEDDNLFVRFDANLGPKDTLMVRLSADDRTTGGVLVGGVITPEAGFGIDERDLQLASTWTRLVNADVISETRLLYSSSRFDQAANSDRPGVSRPSGIFGGNTLNRQRRDETSLQLVQNLTWSRGDHTFKFGVDVAHSRTELSARFNPNGTFLYDYDFPYAPGDCEVGPLDVFDAEEEADARGEPFDGIVPCSGVGDTNGNGTPDDDTQIFGYPLAFVLVQGEPDTEIDDTKIALFAQDRWQVGERWLFDYGLRYDVNTYRLPAEAAVDSIVPNGGAPRDRDNLAPRFGFTFAPYADGRTVMRGGAGVFYDKLVLAFPAVAAVTSGTRLGFVFPQGFAFEVNEDFVETVGVEPLGSLLNDPGLERFAMQFSTGTELDTPYTVQFNLGLDQAIGERSALSLNMVRSLGYNLPIFRDLNPVSGLTVAGVSCRADRIDPSLDVGLPCHLADPDLGSIVAVVTEGRSWYTGLDLAYRWQGEDGWFRAAYTLSKSEDLGFDPLKGGISLPPDSDDIAGERGRADGDRKHRLVLSGEMPVPLMGLRASIVLQYSSGIPFNVTTGQDDNLDGILSDRPPGVGRNTGESTPISPLLRLRQDSILDLGPLPSLHEPEFFQVDVRLMRSFAFRDGDSSGELFLQVFNLLDRENAGLIEGRALSPSFGRTVSLAGPPRSLELGLKVAF